ncbi:MAG TPA: SMI1/KNR4 family protein [Myxococcales bacterium]|nr:SMI1/KNR4 family protein [Myxococcales bacterium]
MYLAKFFHRPPGKDDRELLLIFDSSCGEGHALDHVLLGFVMDGRTEPYMRRDFATAREAVAAFRQAAEDLRETGYVETADTKYTLRTLPADPKPKPAWQQGLDELLLSAIIDDAATQAALIAKLAATPAAQEPFYLWLAARHGFAAAPKGHVAALARAETARDALGGRRASKTPFYIWSLRPLEIEAFIHDLLCETLFAAGDAKAGLAAAQHAQEADGDQYRGGRIAWILCHHFPDREEEAFDQAFRHAQLGGYEAVTALPAYAAYLERRKRRARADRGWRWGGRNEPASEPALREAERKLGVVLPKDYRRFLETPQRSELLVRIDDRIATLRFFAPGQLAKQRDALFRFIGRSEKPSTAEAYFRAQYGVSLRHLVPIAEPTNLSCNIVLHLGKGDRFGWCYRWDHDGAWELEGPQPSFDAAIAALTTGIERRDASVLRFLGIDD